jgi:hypothetical protein
MHRNQCCTAQDGGSTESTRFIHTQLTLLNWPFDQLVYPDDRKPIFIDWVLPSTFENQIILQDSSDIESQFQLETINGFC